MKNFVIVCFSLIGHLMFSQTRLERIRVNFSQAVSDKDLCKQMIDELNAKSNQAIETGYLGGFQAIWANHIFNPISKLKTFNEGKKNLESAIKKEPYNPEIRFIRLSIQKNIPSFLGYKENIENDTEFLKKEKSKLESNLLLRHIETLLKD